MESLFFLSDEKGNDEPKIGCEMNIVPDHLTCCLMVKAPDYYLWGLQVRVLSYQLISEMNILLLLTWYVA